MELFDGAGSFPHNLGGHLQGQVSDDSQRKHFPVIGGEGCQQGKRTGVTAEGVVFGRACYSHIIRRIVFEEGGRSVSVTVMIHDPGMGNTENQSTHSGGTPSNTSQPRVESKEHILGHGFRILNSLRPQVPEDCRGMLQVGGSEQHTQIQVR